MVFECKVFPSSLQKHKQTSMQSLIVSDIQVRMYYSMCSWRKMQNDELLDMISLQVYWCLYIFVLLLITELLFDSKKNCIYFASHNRQIRFRQRRMSVAIPSFLIYETRNMKDRNELFFNWIILFSPHCAILQHCITHFIQKNYLHTDGRKFTVCWNGQGLRPRQIFRKYLWFWLQQSYLRNFASSNCYCHVK